MQNEEWKRLEIANCTYDYFVSSLGRVKRMAATISFMNNGGYYTKRLPEQILKQQHNKSGYRIVSLQLGLGRSNKRTMAVAPMVCRAFHGPPMTEGLECAHLNGARDDNRPANLAWSTHSENEAHKAVHGTRMAGERHHQAKLSADDVRRIRDAVSAPGTELAAMYGVSTTQISDIRTGKSWRHELGSCLER